MPKSQMALGLFNKSLSRIPVQRKPGLIRFMLQQSTDEDAFSDFKPQFPVPHPRPPLVIPVKQPTVAFGTAGKPNNGMTTQEIRDKALKGVQERVIVKESRPRMKGKVGIITGVGPAAGIGTAAARIYAREGAAHLYLLDFNGAPLPAFAEELQKSYSGTKVTWAQGDAASASTISGLVDRAMKEEGRLDFFFANAGVSFLKPKPKAGEDAVMSELQSGARTMENIDPDEFMEVMRINALSVFLAVKYGSAAMGKVNPSKGKTVPGGSLVLTASVAGKLANAGPIAYSASKAAVISIAQSAAYELVGQNIRVNAVCPGLIQTDMTKAAFALARAMGKESRMGTLNPLLRQGLPHEVAELAVWLSSEESSYVNGQAYSVDGGLTASMPYIRARM